MVDKNKIKKKDFLLKVFSFMLTIVLNKNINQIVFNIGKITKLVVEKNSKKEIWNKQNINKNFSDLFKKVLSINSL